MEDTTKGTARRLGIVIDVACKRCDNFMTCTAYGATSVRAPLYARGWRIRYGNWHCPACCGTRHASPLKLTSETT